MDLEEWIAEVIFLKEWCCQKLAVVSDGGFARGDRPGHVVYTEIEWLTWRKRRNLGIFNFFENC
jgi:hypothetical protein